MSNRKHAKSEPWFLKGTPATATDYDYANIDLLAELKKATEERQQAEETLRLLVAYAREVNRDRFYTLERLAKAAGRSASWVRTSYTADEVAEVHRRLAAG